MHKIVIDPVINYWFLDEVYLSFNLTHYSNGNKVPLFNYNGTIYAPVRAFSKAAGFTVDYDFSTRTAVLETNDYAAASDLDSASYITSEKAKKLALQDAGVNAANALFLKSCLDWDDGKACYKVEFCAGNMEYKVDPIVKTKF